MGTWGSRIYEDDTALDVRGDFLDQHVLGMSVDSIEKEILEGFIEGDSAENDVVYLALCCVELETATLTPNTRDKTLEIIESGRQYDFWLAEAGKKDAALRKRELALIRKYLENYDGKPVKRKSWMKLQKGDSEYEEEPEYTAAASLLNGSIKWIIISVVGLLAFVGLVIDLFRNGF